MVNQLMSLAATLVICYPMVATAKSVWGLLPPAAIALSLGFLGEYLDGRQSRKDV